MDVLGDDLAGVPPPGEQLAPGKGLSGDRIGRHRGGNELVYDGHGPNKLPMAVRRYDLDRLT